MGARTGPDDESGPERLGTGLGKLLALAWAVAGVLNAFVLLVYTH